MTTDNKYSLCPRDMIDQVISRKCPAAQVFFQDMVKSQVMEFVTFMCSIEPSSVVHTKMIGGLVGYLSQRFDTFGPARLGPTGFPDTEQDAFIKRLGCFKIDGPPIALELVCIPGNKRVRLPEAVQKGDGYWAMSNNMNFKRAALSHDEWENHSAEKIFSRASAPLDTPLWLKTAPQEMSPRAKSPRPLDARLPVTPRCLVLQVLSPARPRQFRRPLPLRAAAVRCREVAPATCDDSAARRPPAASHHPARQSTMCAIVSWRLLPWGMGLGAGVGDEGSSSLGRGFHRPSHLETEIFACGRMSGRGARVGDGGLGWQARAFGARRLAGRGGAQASGGSGLWRSARGRAGSRSLGRRCYPASVGPENSGRFPWLDLGGGAMRGSQIG